MLTLKNLARKGLKSNIRWRDAKAYLPKYLSRVYLGLIPVLHPTNERRCHKETPSIIGWRKPRSSSDIILILRHTCSLWYVNK